MAARLPPADFARAEQALRDALRAAPGDAEAAYRLALLYHEHGRAADALPHYEQALRLRPQDADALYHLGNALAELGRPDDALDCYRRAATARPDHAEALCNLGVALARRGRLAEAEAHLRRAAEAKPGFAQAHHNLGVALAQQGFHEAAVAALRRALEAQPGYAEAHFNLGNTLSALGRRGAAVASYREALRCRPDYAEALCNLGLALSEMGQPGEAAVLLRQAARLRPQYVEAHNNLGLALAELGRFDEAAACYERALALDPRYAAAHANLGSAYKGLGRPEEAAACYETALRYEPDSASAHWNLALAWLQMGDFGRGWREYEWRWKRPATPPRPLRQPRWEGASLGGRTILLWCEQGLGDAIQFARYAAPVRGRGGRVLLECPDPLRALFRGLAGVDELVPEGAWASLAFDCHAPLMSLPGLLGTTLATVPADVPYLKPDPALVEKWRPRLGPLDGFRVGVAWQGNPHHPWDRWRSVRLAALAPLAEVPGVRLVSLQQGPGFEQLGALQGRFPVADLGDEFGGGGLAAAAAVMASLDLVVSVDTAPAHLAGALGVSVWVALPALVDWRWLLARDDSPWYPTMRLFRQKELGDWEPVFGRMAAALRVTTRAGDRPGPASTRNTLASRTPGA